MAVHDFFSSGNIGFITANQSGSFAPGASDLGTGAPAFAGDYAYHSFVFVGTAAGGAADVGSIVVYASYNSVGGGTTVLGSVGLTRGTGVQAFDLKTDTLTSLGTVGSGTYYDYVSAQLVVAAGSVDVRGAFFGLSYHPRTAGTTPAAVGIRTLGTRYS